MSDTTPLVTTLVDEIEELISPLVAIAESDDPELALRRFLKSAGWTIVPDISVDDVKSIVDNTTDAIDKVQTAVAAAADGIAVDDFGDFADALGAIKSLVAAVTQLVRTIASLGPAVPTSDEFLEFSTDISHTLLVRWITKRRILGKVCDVVGIIETVDVSPLVVGGWLTRSGGQAPRLRVEHIVPLITDPIDYLAARFIPNGWAESIDAAATNLFLNQELDPLLQTLSGRWRLHPDALAGPTNIVDEARLAILEFRPDLPDSAGRVNFGAELEFFSKVDPNAAQKVGPAVEFAPFGGYRRAVLGNGWSANIDVSVTLGGVDVGDSPPMFRVDSDGVVVDAGSCQGRAEVTTSFDVDSLVGSTRTGLRLGSVDLVGFVDIADALDAGFSLVANRATIGLSAADLGGATAAVATFDSEIEFDFGIGWSIARGLHLHGSTSLEIELRGSRSFGGFVTISGLKLRVTVDRDIAATLLANIAVMLGPVDMTFEQVGLKLALSFPDSGGNLGGADLAVTMQQPKGVGIRIDAGVVSGGGFLFADPDTGEYAGVLELSFPALSLSLKAVGIFTTKLPDDSSGYALLMLVFAEFPAIQIGFGFTLNGVGGILGIQHGVSISALQNGMGGGALDHALFPEDPVKNAPAIIATLRKIFPITPGALTFGPALKIGWGAGIIDVSVGIVIQIDDAVGPSSSKPSLARIVLIGQLRAELPGGDATPPIVQLLVDILGSYDFEKRELAIDAALRDSKIAGLPLTGSLVVRARFGDDPTFIMAVGGFHPRFKDLPPGIPSQSRLGMQLQRSSVTVSLTCYVAVTSNSFQFGADVTVVARVKKFKVTANLGFDALFYFEPSFHFIFDFRVSAAISYDGKDLLAAQVTGTVRGPGRWELSGSATVTVLRFSKDVQFREAWGPTPVRAQLTAAILPRVLDALASPSAWSAAIPDGRTLATLRDPGDDVEVLAHPLGTLQMRQKVVPFGVSIEKVGDTKPSDFTRFDLTSVHIGSADVGDSLSTSKEHFARSEYFELSADNQLRSPSFERFDAGISIGSDEFEAPPATEVTIEYETLYPQSQPTIVAAQICTVPDIVTLIQAGYGAIGSTAAATELNLIGTEVLNFSVQAEPYMVINLDSGDATEFSTFTAAAESLANDSELVLTGAADMLGMAQ